MEIMRLLFILLSSRKEGPVNRKKYFLAIWLALMPLTFLAGIREGFSQEIKANDTRVSMPEGGMKNTAKSRGLSLLTAIVFVFIFSIPSFSDTSWYLGDDGNRLRWVEYGNGKIVQYTYDG
jgi:hypothetical protein